MDVIYRTKISHGGENKEIMVRILRTKSWDVQNLKVKGV